MNEELQKKLLEALTASMDTIKDIKDFSIEQAPDILQQALMWYGINYFLQMLVYILISCLVLYWVKYSFKHKLFNTESEVTAMNSISTAIVAPIWFVSGAAELFNIKWLQIWIVPKLFLIEWLKGMM